MDSLIIRKRSIEGLHECKQEKNSRSKHRESCPWVTEISFLQNLNMSLPCGVSISLNLVARLRVQEIREHKLFGDVGEEFAHIPPTSKLIVNDSNNWRSPSLSINWAIKNT
uniref:Uncharacterized protein n=1 Tax=Opuntia streptacantha TaxID=393608 RepID=A0A7C8ZJN2_OPUST